MKSLRSLNSSDVRRVCLFVLALLFVVTVAYSYKKQRRIILNETKEVAVRIVRLTAKNQGEIISSTKRTLLLISQMDEVKDFQNQGACNKKLQGLMEGFGQSNVNVIAVANLNGDVVCSSQGLKNAVNIADRVYFKETVKTKKLAVSGYLMGRLSGVPNITVSNPVFDSSGQMIGVSFISLQLDWLNDYFPTMELPAGSTLEVIDNSNYILAQYPNGDEWVGKISPNIISLQHALINGEGTYETAGLFDKGRIYAYTPLYEGVETKAYVVLNISQWRGFSDAMRFQDSFIVWVRAICAISFALFVLILYIETISKKREKK